MPQFWDYKHRFVYGSKTEEVSELEEIDHPAIRETLRFLNISYGIDMHYNTDIPARSGIGSSSSFTVGLLNSLNGLNGRMVSKDYLAKSAIYIEQNMIKEAVGSQDQTAAAYGGLNHIVFNTDGSINVNPLTIPESRIKELNNHLLLVFTGFQRFAKDIEKGKIDNIEQNTVSLTTMKQYVAQAIDVLNSDVDIREFGKLLDDTWQMKRTLSDKVFDERIDRMYECGLNNGAIGGKLLGAGGGGFMMFFVPPQRRNELISSLHDYVCVPFSFENGGSQVIYYNEM